jgi:hypothetical protein
MTDITQKGSWRILGRITSANSPDAKEKET